MASTSCSAPQGPKKGSPGKGVGDGGGGCGAGGQSAASPSCCPPSSVDSTGRCVDSPQTSTQPPPRAQSSQLGQVAREDLAGARQACGPHPEAGAGGGGCLGPSVGWARPPQREGGMQADGGHTEPSSWEDPKTWSLGEGTEAREEMAWPRALGASNGPGLRPGPWHVQSPPGLPPFRADVGGKWWTRALGLFPPQGLKLPLTPQAPGAKPLGALQGTDPGLQAGCALPAHSHRATL